MHYLAICAIVKDENRDLREWAAYHLLAGVERIVLFDHQSAAPVAAELRPLVERGQVEVLITSSSYPQIPEYNCFLHNRRDVAQWVAFIDADEFLVPVKTDDLRGVLQPFEPHGGLAVNWRMFGSSGHVTR